MPVWLIVIRLVEGIVVGKIWIWAGAHYLASKPSPRAAGVEAMGYLAGVAAGFVSALVLEYVTGLYRYPAYWPWLTGMTVVLAYHAGLDRGARHDDDE